MTSHRPHPISGPWPYLDRTDEPLRSHVPGHYLKRGEVPIIDREPTDGSLIYDDPEDALLWDNCDRCTEHANHPLRSVDNDRLGKLWRRMVEVERDPSYIAYYRTGTEAAACHKLLDVALMIERTHPSIDSWRWPWMLRDAGGYLPIDVGQARRN